MGKTLSDTTTFWAHVNHSKSLASTPPIISLETVTLPSKGQSQSSETSPVYAVSQTVSLKIILTPLSSPCKKTITYHQILLQILEYPFFLIFTSHYLSPALWCLVRATLAGSALPDSPHPVLGSYSVPIRFNIYTLKQSQPNNAFNENYFT